MSAPHSNQMSTQEALRAFVRTKFAKIVPDRPYARNIEKSVWEWAIKETKKGPHPAVWENMWFRNRYKLKATHLLAELQRDPSWITCDLKVGPDGHVTLGYGPLQPQLQHRIFAKELKSSELVDAPAEVLWPDGPCSRARFANIQRDMFMEERRKQEEGYEGILKCGKCKSLKTTYFQLQTRSADEPMVRYISFLLVLTVLTFPPDYIRHLQGLWTQVEVLLEKNIL